MAILNSTFPTWQRRPRLSTRTSMSSSRKRSSASHRLPDLCRRFSKRSKQTTTSYSKAASSRKTSSTPTSNTSTPKSTSRWRSVLTRTSSPSTTTSESRRISKKHSLQSVRLEGMFFLDVAFP